MASGGDEFSPRGRAAFGTPQAENSLECPAQEEAEADKPEALEVQSAATHRKEEGEEPTCLQKLLGHKQDDSFTQTLRKLSAMLNIVVAPFAMAYGCYWILMGATGSEGSGAGSIVMGVLSIILGITIVTNFVLVKMWHEVSDFHVTAYMWCILLPCWFTVIGTPEFGSRMLLIWYSMMAVTNQSNHALPQCAIALLGQVLSCYNNAYSDARGGTPLILPGARLNGPNLEVLGELVGATVVSNSVVIAVYLQGRVYSQTYKEAQQGKAARAAVEMTTNIVELLRKYDTDGVGVMLDDYRQSAVDPDLLRSFRKMKSNLETYRPHLPLYVFQEDEDGADQGDEEMTPVEGFDDDDEGEIDGAHTPSPSPSPRGSGSAKYLTSPTIPQEGPSFLIPQLSKQRRKSSLNSMLGGAAAGGGGSHNVQRRISIALLDCRHLTKSGAAEVNLQHFVNSIYQCASDLRGSIHSILGDVVQVTWNAMAKVGGPEAKAAKFLCRVHKEAMAKQYLVSGAACSGQSRCHNAMSTTKQHVHLVHFQWDGGLAACFALAKRYRTFVADHSTQSNAMCDVDFRPVDQLFYAYPNDDDDDPISYGEMLLDQEIVGKQSGGGGEVQDLDPKELRRGAIKKSLVYEVLSEMNHDEGEWMYQIAKGGGGGKEGGSTNANDVVRSSLDDIIRGHYGDALSQLNELERGSNQGDARAFRASLVQRLIHHCERQISRFS